MKKRTHIQEGIPEFWAFIDQSRAISPKWYLRITLITALVVLCSYLAQAQQRKNFWIKQGGAFGSSFLSGAARGINEVITHNYDQFEGKHPQANDNFWFPRLSANNKYKNGDRTQGAAFPLSTTVLVGLTDGYHMTNSIAIIMATVSMGFSMSLYEKPKLKDIGLQLLITGIGFTVGKGAVHWFYKQ